MPAPSAVTVALETSTRAARVALRTSTGTFDSALTPERAHASDLLPVLSSLFERAAVEPRSIGTVIVGLGPGSFTGLRVGISLALGLCRGTGASLVGIPSFEVAAYGVLANGETASMITDARSNLYYFARYEKVDGDIRVEAEPRVDTLSEVVRASAGSTYVLADTSSFDRARAQELDVPAERAPARAATADPRSGGGTIERSSHWVEFTAPSATNLLELGVLRHARDGSMAPEVIRPLYLRPFAAKKRTR